MVEACRRCLCCSRCWCVVCPCMLLGWPRVLACAASSRHKALLRRLPPAAKPGCHAALRLLPRRVGRARVLAQLLAADAGRQQGQRWRRGADDAAQLQVRLLVHAGAWRRRAFALPAAPLGSQAACCRARLRRSMPRTLADAAEKGWAVVGAAADADTVPLAQFAVERPTLLVMGAWRALGSVAAAGWLCCAYLTRRLLALAQAMRGTGCARRSSAAARSWCVSRWRRPARRRADGKRRWWTRSTSASRRASCCTTWWPAAAAAVTAAKAAEVARLLTAVELN